MDPEEDIDLDKYINEEKPDIDLDDYSNSQEQKQITGWDYLRDVAIQPTLGLFKRFTWPADLLKIGIAGEALSGLDEFEAAAEREGVPFDRKKYLQTVSDIGYWVPTQDLAEEGLEKLTDVSLQPQTDVGKYIRKWFTLKGLGNGQGLQGLIAPSAGTGVTAGLEAVGVPEAAANLIGDTTAGGIGSIRGQPRTFTPEIERLRQISDRNGLPFYEYMATNEAPLINPKITRGTERAIQQELNMSSRDAVRAVAEGQLPAADLRNRGVNLETLEQSAYQATKDAAVQLPPSSTNSIIQDINTEIARRRSLAISPSAAERQALEILENERDAFLQSPTAYPDQLIKQKENYNSNVKGIYRKPEFTGAEEEIRQTYAFLNESIKNNLEQNAPQIANMLRAADQIYAQNSALRNTERILGRAFRNGEYNPQRLHNILNSPQGNILRRELGNNAVSEINEIARYGQQAVANTRALLRSGRQGFTPREWGQMAPFVMAAVGKAKGALAFAGPAAQYVQGYLMTRPATRTVYRNILRNAAKGSFDNMKGDFDKLEKEITKEFGSVDAFMTNVIDELEIDR